MGRSFGIILVIIMLGMALSILFFSSTRTEAAEKKLDKGTILTESGKILGASCDAAAAYAFLRSRASASVELVPKVIGNSALAEGGIEPELACRLQRFLTARPDIRINSGYRSVTKQRNTCRSICGRDSCPGKCASPGNSCHQYGMAVDISVNDKKTRKQALQFQLHFPYSGPHIQCVEQRVAACGRSRTPCAPGAMQISPGSDTAPYEKSWDSDRWFGHKSPQELIDELGEPDQHSTVGGGQAFEHGNLAYDAPEGFEYDHNHDHEEEGLLDDIFGEGSSEDYFGEVSEEGTSLVSDAQDTSAQSAGEDNAATCEGTGLFGTGLFKTCSENSKSDETSSGLHRLENEESAEQGFIFRDGTSDRGVSGSFIDNIISARSVPISYLIHRPNDDMQYQSQKTQDRAGGGAQQFVRGNFPEFEEVESRTPQKGEGFGTYLTRGSLYYSALGVLPTPVRAFALWSGASRVYNPFSI